MLDLLILQKNSNHSLSCIIMVSRFIYLQYIKSYTQIQLENYINKYIPVVILKSKHSDE